jgi:hypothetical protein
VRGVASEVSPTAGFRVFCYCKDCQAFARFLDRADVLDAAGGTDIFQLPPGRVKLAAGADALRCVCLGNRGVFRWYADCCRTPIANTAGAGFPLIGVVHSFMDHAFMDDAFTESLAGGRSRDEVLGPPLCRIHERSATGRCRWRRPRHYRSGSPPAAQRRRSAGGCAGSPGRARSSTIVRTLRARCRACSQERARRPLNAARGKHPVFLPIAIFTQSKDLGAESLVAGGNAT